jgi:hypothetical protein
MKITNLLKLSIPVLMIALLSSCCHQVDCNGGSINVIAFINFDDTMVSKLDSTVIRRFPIGSTYLISQKIDSFRLFKFASISNISSDTTSVTISSTTAPFLLSPGYKYQVVVPGTYRVLPADSTITSSIDSVKDRQTTVQACSGTEYSSRGCSNPLTVIVQDGASIHRTR